MMRDDEPDDIDVDVDDFWIDIGAPVGLVAAAADWFVRNVLRVEDERCCGK